MTNFQLARTQVKVECKGCSSLIKTSINQRSLRKWCFECKKKIAKERRKKK